MNATLADMLLAAGITLVFCWLMLQFSRLHERRRRSLRARRIQHQSRLATARQQRLSNDDSMSSDGGDD